MIQTELFSFDDRRTDDARGAARRKVRLPRGASQLQVGDRVYPILPTGHIDDAGVVYPVHAWVQIQKLRGLAVTATVSDLGGDYEMEV